MYSCNCTFLLRLVFIVFAFALLIVANPVPQGSTDFRDIDGEPMPAEETLSIDEFNPLDGIDDLISSNNPGSSNGADCALRSSRNADNSQENPIFRRGPAACRSNYQTPGEPSVERPVHLEGKPATYQESACTKVHRQKHLWCGGPEVRYTPNDRIVFVMNCVSGNTVPSTHNSFHQSFDRNNLFRRNVHRDKATTSIPRRPRSF